MMRALQTGHSGLRALDRARAGCTYADGRIRYVVLGEGGAQERAVEHGRRQAEIADRRVAAEVDDFRAQRNIQFSEWADRWLDSLERKPSTVSSYRSTIAHAKRAFGQHHVRRLSAEDVADFNKALRERGCSPSTRAKHLRVLGACLQAAVFYRYSESNPVQGVAAGAQAQARKKGGSLLRERGTPSSVRPPRGRTFQDAVLGCTEDRDAAGRAVCASLERCRPRAGSRACSPQLHRRHDEHAEEPRAPRRRLDLRRGRAPRRLAARKRERKPS